jgi:signal transduction histidine kinase
MITLKEWFQKYHTRPLKIVALFLLAVWAIFAIRAFMTLEAKQDASVKQTADLLSIAITQKNRTLAESLLAILVSQGGAASAELCLGGKQQIAISESLLSCNTKARFYESLFEHAVPGSPEFVLRAKFRNFEISSSVFLGFGFTLIMVFIGFYFIQTAQTRIKKNLFDPIVKKLLGSEPLEIRELVDLRHTIKEAKTLEAQKAVTLAIQENNQQVAHDIRSPIQSINALLKMIEIGDPILKAAFEKAVSRADSVANFLLNTEREKKNSKETDSFDLAGVIQDIAIEKRPLFIGGEIEVKSPEHFVAESGLCSDSLSRILSNIVDNAIQACDRDRKIKINLSRSGDFAEITVQDSGRGIPDEILNRIGEKGFSKRSSEQAPGSGRGVYSARKILDEVGGSIQFSSSALGTLVSVKIPIYSFERSEKPDLVFIDNEKMHQMTWAIWARKNALSIQTFSSVEE